MKQTMVRQGDVLLVPIASSAAMGELVPAEQSSSLQALQNEHGGIALAEGETSGHHHGVFGKGARLMQYRDSTVRVVVVAKAGAEMRVVGGGSGGVDRHTPIALVPGSYEVRIQRAYSAGMSSRVAD